MEYTKNKFIIDSLKHNFKFGYEENKLKFYNIDGTDCDYVDILKFLYEEFDMDVDEANKISIRWTYGDIYADYIFNSPDIFFEGLN